MLEIFKYQCPKEFLKDSYAAKKQLNPSFSIRAWAKQLGYKNNAPLTQMLAGNRPIPLRAIPLLIKSLKLNTKEGLYFERLVNYDNAKTASEKKRHLNQLQKISPLNKVTGKQLDTFRTIEDPLHMTVLEMTELADFKPEPKWIQNRLKTPVKLTELKSTIDRLRKLELIRESEGRLLKTHKHLTTKSDQLDMHVQEYHKRASAMASEIGIEQTLAEREFQAFDLSIRKKDLARAKELIREFRQQFIDEMEVSQGDEIYHMNIQFFNLTKGKT